MAFCSACIFLGRMLVTPANIVPRHFLKKNVSMDGMLKYVILFT